MRHFGFPRGFLTRLRRFGADLRGGVAVVFSLTSLIAIGMIAMTVEYARVLDLKAHMQEAIDAGMLAAAAAPEGADRQRIMVQTASTMFTRELAQANVDYANYQNNSGMSSGAVFARMPLVVGTLWTPYFDVKASTTVAFVPKTSTLDMVWIIDATSGMTTTIAGMNTLLPNILSQFNSKIVGTNYNWNRIRLRLVLFRDYGYDAEPIASTPFVDISGDLSPLINFMAAETATGGGDAPNSGLEGLNEALDSSWTRPGDTVNGKTVDEIYSLIYVITRNGAHPPAFAPSMVNGNYPPASKMPRDYTSLQNKWNNVPATSSTHKVIHFLGNSDLQDDALYGAVSGWSVVKAWPNFNQLNFTNPTQMNGYFASPMSGLQWANISKTLPYPTTKPVLVK